MYTDYQGHTLRGVAVGTQTHHIHGTDSDASHATNVISARVATRAAAAAKKMYAVRNIGTGDATSGQVTLEPY